MVLYTRLHNYVHSVLYNPNPMYTCDLNWLFCCFAESGFELGQPIDQLTPVHDGAPG